jgi:hypothetical protein
MSVISKYPVEFKNLSLPSVAYFGWPPPTHISSKKSVQYSNPIPLTNDEIDHHRILSIGNNNESYFEKLRSAAEGRYAPDNITANVYTPTDSHSDDTLEDLIRSIRPSVISNFDEMKNNPSQVKLLRQIYLDHKLKAQHSFDNYTFTISTPDGNLFFDFTKQSINYTIYIQLMQLVRLSNLDKIIQKIFHKSGFTQLIFEINKIDDCRRISSCRLQRKSSTSTGNRSKQLSIYIIIKCYTIIVNDLLLSIHHYQF